MSVLCGRPQNSDVLLGMMEVMLPFNGGALVLVNASFDESIGAVDGRRLLCVAGYLVTAKQTKRFVRGWQKRILNKFKLPYFRMSACAHGNDPFDHLSLEERIQAAKAAIDLIKKYTIFGAAVTVDLDEYDEIAPKHPLIGSAYSFCIHCIVGGVQSWAERTGFKGDIAYFFEAGHESESEANKIMSYTFRVPELREASRYAGHAFVDKRKSKTVQAADLLAWQWYTDRRHELEGRPRRKDCASLLEHRHVSIHVGPDRLRQLQAMKSPPDGAREFLDRLYRGG